MSRGKGGPSGGRPPGRRGRAGSGPSGPPRTGGTGRGTKHKSSSVEGSPIINVVWAVGFMALLLVGTPVVGLAVLWLHQ